MSYPYSQTSQQAAEALGVNPQNGLSDTEAAERLNQHGKNTLIKTTEVRFLGILKEEITEPMILLLIAVGVLYSILGDLADALTIITIIIILVLAEVFNEYRAKRSISALKQLAPPTAQVIRNSKPVEVETAFLAPGDILLLKVGQRVPADARIIEAYGLEVDESSLTGESLPVTKDTTAVLPPHTSLLEQTNMLFSGTIITRGRATALVTATGINSELGRIAGITKTEKEPKTSLQLAMKQLSKTLFWIALFFSITIPLLAYLRGLQPNPAEAVLYGLSLAFVVIPEELPIIITMVLGVGSYALSRKGAIIKRLHAAETLGNVTVIATDKTGTITENKMQTGHLYFDGKTHSTEQFGPNEKSALNTALLASDGVSDTRATSGLGNPMAQAIFEYLKQHGVTLQSIAKDWLLKDELSFDVQHKLATYIYQYGNSQVAFLSGAPEKVLEKSDRILIQGEETPLTDAYRSEVSMAMSHMAETGERLLAFGYYRILSEVKDKTRVEEDFVFVGTIGFIDPPRKEVSGAIRTCQEAGIRVIMITGDHPQTARTIASQVGINSTRVLSGGEIANITDEALKIELKRTSVFARVTPEDKLRLVRLLKANGEIVAVTGDGINDAPALKEAHIGIAMGVRGTDVAKEASNMVLTDDNFATIEVAVKEGRKLFGNLRKGVRYYLACKVALVSIFIVPIILGIPLPFAPIQIIVLELFMDLAASAAFVAEIEEAGIMKKPPINPKEKFLNKPLLRSLFLGSLSLFGAVTATYLVAWYQTQNIPYAHSVAFATWMLGHIFLALNFRSEKAPLIKQGLLSNKVMLLWAITVFIVLVVGTTLPFTQAALQITSLTLQDWALVMVVSFAATFWMEVTKILGKTA